jgi:hypothetical protein
VTAHNLQNRGEDNASGTNAVFQSFDIGGFINFPMRGIERNNQRGIESGRAQRFDEKRCWLQVEQPLQPAGRLRSDQRDDRGANLPQRGQIALDGNGVGSTTMTSTGSSGGAICAIPWIKKLPASH